MLETINICFKYNTYIHFIVSRKLSHILGAHTIEGKIIQRYNVKLLMKCFFNIVVVSTLVRCSTIKIGVSSNQIRFFLVWPLAAYQ